MNRYRKNQTKTWRFPQIKQTRRRKFLEHDTVFVGYSLCFEGQVNLGLVGEEWRVWGEIAALKLETVEEMRGAGVREHISWISHTALPPTKNCFLIRRYMVNF